MPSRKPSRAGTAARSKKSPVAARKKKTSAVAAETARRSGTPARGARKAPAQKLNAPGLRAKAREPGTRTPVLKTAAPARNTKTTTIRLYEIAHARSGDKGAGSNVGIFVLNDEAYEFIRRELTPERVRRHFKGIVLGSVVRYELPNVRALNFILNDSLGGGGSESLKNDAQGKTHGQALLMMEVTVPTGLLARYPARTHGPRG